MLHFIDLVREAAKTLQANFSDGKITKILIAPTM